MTRKLALALVLLVLLTGCGQSLTAFVLDHYDETETAEGEFYLYVLTCNKSNVDDKAIRVTKFVYDGTTRGEYYRFSVTKGYIYDRANRWYPTELEDLTMWADCLEQWNTKGEK